MKKPLFLLPVILLCSCLCGQVGVKFTHIRPTGELGAVMKPTFGGEIVWKALDDDEGFTMRYGLAVAKFHPRMDTFPTYGVMSGSGTTVLPGYTVFHKYNVMTITAGFDYVISLSDNFSFYPGLDFGVELTAIEYDSRVETMYTEGYSGGSTAVVGRLRAGAEYMVLEKLAFFAEVQRNLAFSIENGGLAYNVYGIGVRYNF